jgi:hypothetical protein
MRSGRTRLRMRIAALTVSILTLLVVTATGAEAKFVKLSGQTTVTPTAQANAFLAANGVTVAPVAPATAANGSFTFPIQAGFGNTQNFNGIIAHSGGLQFTKNNTSVVVRRFVAVRFHKRAFVLAQVPDLKGGCKKLRKAVNRFATRHPRARHRARRKARRHPKAARELVQAVKDYCKDGRVIVLGRLRNLHKDVTGDTATLSADLHLSKESAKLVNQALGTNVPAGALFASAVSNVTLGQ